GGVVSKMKLEPMASGAAALPASSVGRTNTVYRSLSSQGTCTGVLHATEKASVGVRVVGKSLEESRTSQFCPFQYNESDARLTRTVTMSTFPLVSKGVSLAVPLRDVICPA